MEKMKLNIQLFAVKVNTHTLTVDTSSYNAANSTINVRYVLKLTTTSTSHNNNNITSTYYIDGNKYTSTHKLPTTTTTTIFDRTIAVPYSSGRVVSASYSVPTGISAGTMTGSTSVTLPAVTLPIQLNGVGGIQKVNFNGTDIEHLYFNGTKVF